MCNVEAQFVFGCGKSREKLFLPEFKMVRNILEIGLFMP